MSPPEIITAEAEYDEDGLEAVCDNCGSIKFNIVSNGPHSEQRCAQCDAHIKYVPKPSDGTRRKSTIHDVKDIIDDRGYDEAKCFFCRRPREMLGYNETLEVDHIKELHNEDGEDRIENLQVLCTACHKLKNWMRLYHNEHMVKAE